jgi:uncharacterized protein
MVKDRIVRDSVYSFISFEKNGLVNKIIDTIEFQRLKYINQLGLSYFTYPNAVHSRFSHSLGTYWLSKRLARELGITGDDEKKLSIAALLHDIGHGPFSHVLENKIMSDRTHEQISKEIIESGEHSISALLEDHGIKPREISEIVTSGTMPKYLHKLISSQIDVDRLDYLLRDSILTGNPHGRYDLERIIHTIRLNEDHEIYISRGGWNAVEHYLICRYQMYKQLYYHHSTLAAEELVKKIIDRAKNVFNNGGLSSDEKRVPILKDNMNRSEYMDIADFDVLHLIRGVRHCGDAILSDLSNRFLKRQLLKSIVIDKKNAMKLYESKEEIKSIIEKKGYDSDYYFSHVDLSKKLAYKPYTPNTKDQEEAIFIDSDCIKEISQEIKSLGAISTPDEILLFIPEDCRQDIRKILP